MGSFTGSPHAPEPGQSATGQERPPSPLAQARALAARDVGAILVKRIESGEFDVRQRKLAEAAVGDPWLMREKGQTLNDYELEALHNLNPESESPGE